MNRPEGDAPAHDDSGPGIPPEEDVVEELGVRHTAMGATAPADTYPDDLPKREAP